MKMISYRDIWICNGRESEGDERNGATWRFNILQRSQVILYSYNKY